MFTLKKSISFDVRYCETDQMGLVHHSCYLPWYEVGRIKLMESLGIYYTGVEKQGYFLTVIGAKLEYKSSMFFGDIVTVKTRVNFLNKIKISFYYECFNHKKELCNLGETVHVFLNLQKKVVRIPDFINKKLAPYF